MEAASEEKRSKEVKKYRGPQKAETRIGPGAFSEAGHRRCYLGSRGHGRRGRREGWKAGGGGIGRPAGRRRSLLWRLRGCRGGRSGGFGFPAAPPRAERG